MRSWFLMGIVCLMLAFVCAMPVQAAAKAEADGHGSGEHSQKLGVEHGLFKGAIEVSLWTILVFLLLLFVLHRFAWGPILEGLNKREQSIARDKHEAELARKEAAELRTKLDAELARAADEVRQMIDKARQDAQKTASEELARGKSELQAEKQRLRNELSIERDNALKDVWTRVSSVATLISGKVIKKKLTEEDHRALIDEALNEFRAAAAVRKSDVEGARA
jgi:F-type H+-transporting ATPase subunit b